MERLFSRAQGLEVAEGLHRAAGELKQPFADWIAAIGSQQRNPVNWWCARLASRSPLQTDAFLLLCCVRLITGWVRGDAPPGQARILVVGDPWLWCTLKSACVGIPTVRFAGAGTCHLVVEAASWWLRMPLAAGRACLWGVLSWGLARWYWPRANDPDWGQERKAVLLYTWIVPRCFSVSGAFQDPYTGRLADILQRRGEPIVRLTPLKIGIRNGLLRRLRSVKTPCLISPRALRLADVLRASVVRWRIDGWDQLQTFEGMPCRLLLWRELLHEWGSVEFGGYALWYLTLTRLAKRYGRHVHTVIYPFENQPWEKLLCLAFRQEAPWVRLIGYQHACVTPFLLNYQLGRGEPAFAPLPDHIVATGELSLQLLKEGGFPTKRLANGGAFRYEHLLTASAPGRLRSREGSSYRVLVALPLSRFVGGSLLRDLVELFPQPRLNGAGHTTVRFIVKGHPQLPVAVLTQGRGMLPAWFEVTERPLHELLREADLLLCAPPTASRWEAAMIGVPVLRYQGAWIDMDAAEPMNGERVALCSKNQLKAAMTFLLTQAASAEDESARARGDRAFSPVNEQVWMELMGDH